MPGVGAEYVVNGDAQLANWDTLLVMLGACLILVLVLKVFK